MANRISNGGIELDHGFERFMDSAKAGDEGALHSLRKVILQLRWVGKEDEAVETAKQIRSLLPGDQARRIPNPSYLRM